MRNAKALALLERSESLTKKKRQVEKFVRDIFSMAIRSAGKDPVDFKIEFDGGYWHIQSPWKCDERRILLQMYGTCHMYVDYFVDQHLEPERDEVEVLEVKNEDVFWTHTSGVKQVHENLDALLDGMTEKFPKLSGRLHELFGTI